MMKSLNQAIFFSVFLLMLFGQNFVWPTTCHAKAKTVAKIFSTKTREGLLCKATDKRITVRDKSGAMIFDSTAVAADDMRALFKSLGKVDWNCATVHISESYQLASVVGKYVSFCQSMECETRDKSGMCLGAHPTTDDRYVVVNCDKLEQLGKRNWGENEHYDRKHICLLTDIFSQKDIRRALLESDDFRQWISDDRVDTKVDLQKLLKPVSGIADDDPKYVLNRFVFESVSQNKVIVALKLHVYHQGFQTIRLALPIPQQMKADLKAAASGRAGLLEKRCTENFPPIVFYEKTFVPTAREPKP